MALGERRQMRQQCEIAIDPFLETRPAHFDRDLLARMERCAMHLRNRRPHGHRIDREGRRRAD
jgi:hypothetical protein